MDSLRDALKKAGLKSSRPKKFKYSILLQCDCGAILDKKGGCRICGGPSELTRRANNLLRKEVK